MRMTRIVLTFPAIGLVTACTTLKTGLTIGHSPRVQLSYFNPAQRIMAPVTASIVTVQDRADSRRLNIDVEVRAPNDSGIVVILQDGFEVERLRPLLGEAGVADVLRSQRPGAGQLALPVIQVSTEKGWTPLERRITDVVLGKVSVRESPFCVFPASRDGVLRFRQLVLPVAATRNARYRVRVNWISYPSRVEGLPFCPTSEERVTAGVIPESALANDLEAYARRVDLNWWGVGLLSAMLLGGVIAITGS